MIKWTSILLVSFITFSCGSQNEQQEGTPQAVRHQDPFLNQPGFFANAQNQFPFWFIWMDQQNQREEQRLRAELELNRAKAELKRAEAAKERAKIQVALIKVQQWQKTLAEIDQSIKAHKRQIKTYETYSQSLTKIDRGDTGGDVVNAFQFFTSKMPTAKGLLTDEIGPFEKTDFIAASYVYQHQDGRVEVIRKEVDAVPSKASTLSGLLEYLRTSKVKVKTGSEAHKALINARDELVLVAKGLIAEESAEVEKQMQQKIKVQNDFKDPFAAEANKDKK